MAGIDQNFLQA